jgi:hypothetical protein
VELMQTNNLHGGDGIQVKSGLSVDRLGRWFYLEQITARGKTRLSASGVA